VLHGVILCADVDEQSKQQIKDALLTYDRTLLVADPRQTEPKKWVGARQGAGSGGWIINLWMLSCASWRADDQLGTA
jgi:hypothetical protein